MNKKQRNQQRRTNSSRNNKQQKEKQLISILFCCVLLIATVGILRFLTGFVKKHMPVEEAAVQSERIIDDEISAVTGSAVEEAQTTEIQEEDLNNTAQKTYTVCIDAGHGGKDGGSTNSAETRLEKEDTLNISLKIRDCLVQQGVNVIMTREGDEYPTLTERCQTANDAGADFFISMHRNLGEGSGMEMWISHNASALTETMAQNIYNGLLAVGVSKDRGIKKGSSSSEEEDYFVTCNTAMPSCIIELGFMNNDEDNALFDQNIDAYAKAIADALMKTIQENSSTETTESPQTDSETTSPEAVKAASQGYSIQNEQISTDGLDTTMLEWGSGGDKDELGRPVGANLYQEKYGKYNAYFVFNQTDEKVIYLTSDEGYENGCTPDILDTLKEKNVKATFFITMDFAKDNGDLVQRMIDEGHIVGNHSLTHPDIGVCNLPLEEQKKEVMEVDQYVRDNFGYQMFLFRYPLGKFSEQSIAFLNNLNYKSVFWSFAYKDYDIESQPDTATSLENCLNSLHPGAIYLLHAVSTTNRDILGDFIDGARERGYEFALLSPDM